MIAGPPPLEDHIFPQAVGSAGGHRAWPIHSNGVDNYFVNRADVQGRTGSYNYEVPECLDIELLEPT